MTNQFGHCYDKGHAKLFLVDIKSNKNSLSTKKHSVNVSQILDDQVIFNINSFTQ